MSSPIDGITLVQGFCEECEKYGFWVEHTHEKITLFNYWILQGICFIHEQGIFILHYYRIGSPILASGENIAALVQLSSSVLLQSSVHGY